MAILKYAKNVAASIKYTLPGVAERLFPDAAALAQQVRSAHAEYGGPLSTLREATGILREDVSTILSKGLDSLKTTAKTGSFGPKDPEEMAASFGEAMGIDPSVFDNSFLNGDGVPDPNASAAKAAAFGAAHGIAALSKNITDSPSMRATAASTEASARFAKASLGTSIAIGNQIRGAIAATNEVLIRMANFQATTQRAYYEKSLEQFTQTASLMREMSSKMTSLIQASTLNAVASDSMLSTWTGKGSDFSRAFASTGGFNVSEYMKIIQGRAKEAVSLGGMLKMAAAAYAANPIGELAADGIHHLIPGKGQLAQFNKFIGSLPGVLNQRLGHAGDYLYNKGSAGKGLPSYLQQQLGALLQMFSVRPQGGADLSRGITTKAVAFDGLVRHSIVEVIPNYLSFIHSELYTLRKALAPGSKVADRMAFDYKTGRMTSAKAAAAQVRQDAMGASRAAVSPFLAKIGARDDADAHEGLMALARQNFSINRTSGVKGIKDQLEAAAAAAAKAGDLDRARQIRAAASRVTSAMAADPRNLHRMAYDLQDALAKSIGAQHQVWASVTDPASAPGAARMALAGEMDGGDLGGAFGAWEARNSGGAGPAKKKGQSFGEAIGLKKEQAGYHNGEQGSIFRDADGKVTARSVLRAPWVAVSRAMDYLERGVAYALFGKSEGGGIIGRAKEFLIGSPGSGPNGGRGGLFGGVYDYIVGKGRAARDLLLGKDGERGLLGVAKDRLMGAIDRASLYIFGSVGADGRRSGGLVGSQIQKGKDLLSQAGVALNGFVKRMNERLFGEGGLVGRLEQSVKIFFMGDPAKKIPGFVDRVIKPARDFVLKEVWEPLKKNTLEIWDQAGAFLKKEVVEPLRGVFQPFVVEAKHQWELLKGWTWTAAKMIGSEIDGVFKRSFGKGLGDMLRENVLNPIKDALSGVRKFLGDTLGALLKIPVGFLKSASDQLAVSQLRRGVASGMPAETRQRLIKEYGLTGIPEGSGSSLIKSGPAAVSPSYQAFSGVGGQNVTANVSLGSAIKPTAPSAAATAAAEQRTAAAMESGSPPPSPTAAHHGVVQGAAAQAAAADVVTAAIRAATIATADNTRNMYVFMTRNLWGVASTLSRMARHFGVPKGGSKSGPEGSGPSGLVGRVTGKIGSFFSSPFRFISGLVGGLITGVTKALGTVLKLPFKVLGAGIDLFNRSIKFVRESMGEIFGFIKDGLNNAFKGFFFLAGETVKLFGTAFGEVGNVLLGKPGPNGKRTGGVLGGLVSVAGQLGRGLGNLVLGVARVGVELAKFGGEVIRTVASVIKDGVLAVGGTIFGGIGAVGKTVTGIATTRKNYSNKLAPVYVVGGYLAGTSGGAKSLAEAEAGVTGVAGRIKGAIGRAASAARGLFGRPAADGDHELQQGGGFFERAKRNLSGGFQAVKDRIAQSGAAKTMAEWRHRLLASSEGSEGHLGAIRKGFSGVWGLLTTAVPLILGFLGGIWEFFKDIRLAKAFASLLGGGGAAAAVEGGTVAAGATPAAGAARGGLLSRIPGFSRLMKSADGLAGRALGAIPGSARLAGALKGLAGSGAGKFLGGLSQGKINAAGIGGIAIDWFADDELHGTARKVARTVGTGLEYAGLGATLGSMFGPDGQVAGSLIGFAAGATIENWGAATRAMSGAAAGLANVGSIAGRILLGPPKLAAALAGDVGKSIKDYGVLGTFRNALVGGVAAAADAPISLVDSLRAALLGKFDPAAQGAKSLLDNIWQGVSNTLSDWGKALAGGMNRFGGAISSIGGAIAGGASAAGGYVSSVAQGVGSYFGGVGASVGGAGGAAISSFGGAISGGGAAVGGAFSGVGGTAGGAFSSAGRGITTASAALGTALAKPSGIAPGSPAVMDAIKRAALKVGVPVGTLMAIAQQESSFRPDVGASTSSAKGLFQFVDGTWGTMVQQYGAKDGVKLSDIYSPLGNAMMGAEYLKQNMTTLQRVLGRPPNATEAYSAHMLGPEGATTFLRALQKNPRAQISSILPGAAASNSFMYGMTVQDFYNFLYTKVGSHADAYAAKYDPASAPKPAGGKKPVSLTPAQAKMAASPAGKAVLGALSSLGGAAVAGLTALAGGKGTAPAPSGGSSLSMATTAAVDQSTAAAAAPDNDNAPPPAAPAAYSSGGPAGDPSLATMVSLLQVIAKNTGDTVGAVKTAAASGGGAGGPASPAKPSNNFFAMGGKPGAGVAPQISPAMQRVVAGR